jgi:hypothetical protein
MTYVNLPKPGSVMRDCFKCKRVRIPEGGIETAPGKWKCADCWRGFRAKVTKEQNK